MTIEETILQNNLCTVQTPHLDPPYTFGKNLTVRQASVIGQ